jgi:hypothetical protein
MFGKVDVCRIAGIGRLQNPYSGETCIIIAVIIVYMNNNASTVTVSDHDKRLGDGDGIGVIVVSGRAIVVVMVAIVVAIVVAVVIAVVIAIVIAVVAMAIAIVRAIFVFLSHIRAGEVSHDFTGTIIVYVAHFSRIGNDVSSTTDILAVVLVLSILGTGLFRLSPDLIAQIGGSTVVVIIVDVAVFVIVAAIATAGIAKGPFGAEQ